MSETPPIGWLVHYSSRKLVHPQGGSANPSNNTSLVIHDGGLGESRLQVQFEPVDGQGHFGYIKHVPSGKYVHPYGGDINPGNDTYLVYHSGKHSACLFGFNETDNRIVHKGSKRIWHPKGGKSNPGNNTACVLHSDEHDAATFIMTDSKGNEISPYPPVTLSGTYQLLQAVVDAKADHIYEITHEVGKVQTETSTEKHAWKVSAKVSKGLFSASAEYSGFVQKSNAQTWSSKTTVKRTISIKKGQTVATWQYNFGLSQYGDECKYLSNIIVDTDDPKEPPQ